MNVSEIARQVGIATSAVRFYERRGVLPRPNRQSNGYREYTSDDLCRLRLVVSLRQLGLGLSIAGQLADLCLAGQCDLMARDLRPLIASERAALARTRAELDALDRQLASLERSLADADPDPDLCLTKGGDRDDQLRLRPELPVSANAKLRVLNHPS